MLDICHVRMTDIEGFLTIHGHTDNLLNNNICYSPPGIFVSWLRWQLRDIVMELLHSCGYSGFRARVLPHLSEKRNYLVLAIHLFGI